MSTSTMMVSGLASGLDWRSMIDELMKVEHRRVDLVSDQKTEYENQLSAWQELNTKLLALKSAAESLKNASAFNLYTTTLSSSSSTSASDILSASADSTAVPGSYSIEVIQRAAAHRISSKSFTSQTSALGASYSGSFLVNGNLVTVSSSDTLVDVRDRINELNSGANPSNVIASIVSYSSTDYRLLLTSQEEGAEGISIQQVGSSNLLEAFGFTTSTTTIKHATSDGAKSDAFSSSATSVSTLLGLSSAPSGTVTIEGQALTIDLSDTLTQIASDIDALSGVSAQVVSSTVDGETVYQIDISGTTSFSDDNNVLQTLGILRGTYGSVQDIHTSDTANTKIGGGAVDATTTWGQVDTGGGANNITNGDTITIQGTKHDGTSVSATYTINDKTTDTIQDLLDAIEAAFGNVTASVTASGKIQVTDNTSGDSALSILLISNNEGGGDLDLGTLSATQQGYSMELQAGQDALFKVDGNYLTRSSNTITDAITGVTLNLNKAETGTTVTLDVSRDVDGIIDEIQDFVDVYNDAMEFIQTQSSYDQESQEPGGVLFGDGTLHSVKSDLMNNVINQVWGVSSEFSTLAMVGIHLDNDGMLEIEEDTLGGYLRTNFEDVKRLFAANASTTTGDLDYVSHSRNSQPGTYVVHIDQVATQGSVTGITDLSGGLGGDDSLTITVGSASATIDLLNGWSLSQIVDAINTELDQEYAEIIVGDKVLYSDAGMTTPITNSTTWDSVYDDTGVSAGLQNGDTIEFSGTMRNGTAVSGSYTISDITTDTVQGLLSAIESAFSNSVIASINASGEITLTDKYAGTSDISLTVTPVRNLDFGTIDIDPAGSDGSREGRYAIPVSASASADGKNLVLTHDYYGSANSFTVSQTSDIVLGAGKDGTYAGVDVQGTINGESATGSGQNLTGDSGTANVDGLVVSYSGSSIGDVGSITLTLGVAEAFDRSLFYITDSYEGYVAYKQTSLQNNIDRLETRIEEMEARLEQKMQTLINQFVAMEKALSTLQSQSSWLTSQIQSLNSIWGL